MLIMTTTTSITPNFVAPTAVNLSVSGLTSEQYSQLGILSNMNYITAEKSNPSNYTEGAGTIPIDSSWNVTVTILYFGSKSSVNTALSNANLNTISDGSSIKTTVESIATLYGENFSQFEFSVELIRDDPMNSSYVQVAKLGEADVGNSNFFGGTSSEYFDFIEHGGGNEFGFFAMSSSDLDSLLPSSHGLTAGNYGVVKVINDNGTPSNTGDDTESYQLQEVTWDGAAWVQKAVRLQCN